MADAAHLMRRSDFLAPVLGRPLGKKTFANAETDEFVETESQAYAAMYL